jgi:hypothetical protein
MTEEQIRKVSNPKYWETGSRFIAIDGNEVLWYDSDQKLYCVNTFVIEGKEVIFSPMPHKSYK